MPAVAASDLEQTWDVIVAGGGPAGLPAAVAAARAGARTLLVERYGFLGGNSTAAMVNPFMPWYTGGRQVIAGLFVELVERLRAIDGWGGPREPDAFDPESVKFVADDLCREAGVSVLLHTLVVDAPVGQGDIAHLATASKSGMRDLRARVFIDCTGDADVAFRAGVPCEQGRSEDGLTQPMTLNFRMAAVDIDRMPPRDEINRRYVAAKARGEITNPRENVLLFFTPREGVVHFNTTRIVRLDGTRAEDLTAAEVEGRRQVREMMRFLHDEIEGFESAYLQVMGPQIGVRETRRIAGDYVLTEEDVLEAHTFADGIARGCYPIDIHNPAGTGTIIKELRPGEAYDVPYRCLLPVGIGNLIVAGRPISATHQAHSSLRVMPICFALGQAAGAAAALCVRDKRRPRELDPTLLRDHLRAQGADLG
jgi:hypothetical protein